jgi:Fe-Mn family superoxide dismutase
MKKLIFTFIAVAFSYLLNAQQCTFNQKVSDLDFYKLPYDYSALQPVIDAQTVEIHYSRHHQGYFKKFVKAAADIGLANKSIMEIMANVSNYPTAVRNNVGGYFNHVLYWQILKPGNRSKISNELSDAINNEFGSKDNLIAKLNEAALTRFGSGWAWLVVEPNGKLTICSTPNQDNPLMDISDVKGMPIIAIDVWEHAYYLKYQNKRADYVKGIWSLINWEVVSELYAKALNE